MCARDGGGWAVWIGQRCWPSPASLAKAGLAGRSLLVDPGTHTERVWAADLALRCPAVGAVVLDGAGLTMAESRRLHLSAGSPRDGAQPALGLVVRPGHEVKALSAARTRWMVCPALSDDQRPRWAVRLARWRGRAGEDGAGAVWASAEPALSWLVRYDHETGGVSVVPAVGGGCLPATDALEGRRARAG
ncbi:MAG: hypothetical protein JNK35_07240 [Phycisphaerae bacterium]|nr:hypothetical protein [Phycisphaerae bacterium]